MTVTFNCRAPFDVGQPLIVGLCCSFSQSLWQRCGAGVVSEAPSVHGCGPDIGPFAASTGALTQKRKSPYCCVPVLEPPATEGRNA